MKKSISLVMLAAFLVLCFVCTGSASGQEDIPTVTLPISSLLEVRKELIQEEGNAYPDGWDEYYFSYRGQIRHVLFEAQAGPFDMVSVYPVTLEMRWVEILWAQDRYGESEAWVEEEYDYAVDISSRYVYFDAYLYSDSEPLLDEEHLRFIFQDSTGNRTEGEIVSYFLEPIKPSYQAAVRVGVPLMDNASHIDWFSLHISTNHVSGTAQMRWIFQED